MADGGREKRYGDRMMYLAFMRWVMDNLSAEPGFGERFQKAVAASRLEPGLRLRIEQDLATIAALGQEASALSRSEVGADAFALLLRGPDDLDDSASFLDELGALRTLLGGGEKS